MTVIAMTREMGTLGKDVAAGLAEALNINVVHHELVEHHVAERMKVGESAVHRFLEGRSSLWERWQIDTDRMSRYTADEVLQLAAKGNVLIRGWGAAQLLQEIPHVMCVRICAPMPKRIAEMKQRLDITDTAVVRREIERSDDAHSRTVERQFGSDWRNAENYDISLNTGYISVKLCIDQLQDLARSGDYDETEASMTALADKSLEASVRQLLDAQAPDTPFGSGLNVSVSNGEVTIDGVVSETRNLGDVTERIAELEGVKRVDNKVYTITVRSGV